VGINLLREGLDIPEVGFIGILDADKESFLRDHRSLIQIIGRAARNVNGKVILDAEDRELLKQEVINITLEDDQVKELTAGKNFTTYVTLAKFLQQIEDITVDDSTRRIHIEFDYVAVVTLMFEDGSGYTIPVNWEEWTVGEPEYSQQISPPESIVRIGPAESDERRSTVTG